MYSRAYFNSRAVLCCVMAVVSTLVLQTVDGTITCSCTTDECIRDNTPHCTATQYCYSQILPRQGTLIFGCIDRRTPLLCENRIPSGPVSQDWPILFCCNTDRCNFDIIPTHPPLKSGGMRGLPLREATDDDPPLNDSPASLSQEQPDDYGPDLLSKQYNNKTAGMKPHSGSTGVDDSTHHTSADQVVPAGPQDGVGDATHHIVSEQTNTINPLYIGVPVAGACVLLALVIFTVYIIKRQNALQQHYQYEGAVKQNGALSVMRCTDQRQNHPNHHHHHHQQQRCLYHQYNHHNINYHQQNTGVGIYTEPKTQPDIATVHTISTTQDRTSVCSNHNHDQQDKQSDHSATKLLV